MKKSHLRIGLLTAIAVLALSAWWIFTNGSGEPVYQGKRLSYWLQALDYSRRDYLNISTRDANRAVRAAGTNSFPLLLRMLRSTDSPARLRIMKLVEKQHIVKVEFNTAESRHRQATMAFVTLGPRALKAIPDLIKIYDQNPSESSQIEIIQVFGNMGPAAKEALPLLNRALSGTNSNLRGSASNALQNVNPARPFSYGADESIHTRLNDYKTWQQAEGARMIYAENFGSPSHFASLVPDLINLLKQNRPNSYWLTFALEYLDPDAAAKFLTNIVETPEPPPSPSQPGVLGNSRLLAAGQWSSPFGVNSINRLSARLLIYDNPHLVNSVGEWWGDTPVEMEIREVNEGVSGAPSVVYLDDRDGLKFELRDAHGKIIPPESGDKNLTTPQQWIIVPFDGTIRFGVDSALPASHTKPDGLTLRLAGNVWHIPASDTNPYILSGSYEPTNKHTNDLDYPIWSGTLPLRDVRFTAGKP